MRRSPACASTAASHARWVSQAAAHFRRLSVASPTCRLQPAVVRYFSGDLQAGRMFRPFYQKLSTAFFGNKREFTRVVCLTVSAGGEKPKVHSRRACCTNVRRLQLTGSAELLPGRCWSADRNGICDTVLAEVSSSVTGFLFSASRPPVHPTATIPISRLRLWKLDRLGPRSTWWPRSSQNGQV